MNRTDRLMAILLEFQARRERRAEDLAAHFEVSVRTIYRDVQALCEGGVPIAAMPGVGYRLLDGYFLPPLTFSAPEAAALALGGAFVRDRVDPALAHAAEAALRKLEGVLPPERRDAVARWQHDLQFVASRPSGDDAVLGALREAVQTQRVVHLCYQTPQRSIPVERDVEPVSLIHVSGAWHLAAYCRLRQGARFFRLDRIDHLAVTDETFVVAARHQIGPETADRLSSAPEARIRFDPAVIRSVRERQSFLFRREEYDASGPIFVYALPNEADLTKWLLPWGASFEVLAPDSIRDALIRAAEEIRGRQLRTA